MANPQSLAAGSSMSSTVAVCTFIVATSIAPARVACQPRSDGGGWTADGNWASMVGPATEDPHTHNHDGFYLRLGAGIGFLHDSVSSNAFDGASFNGVAVMDELAIGGTIAPGVVLGGASRGVASIAPALRIDDQDRDGPNLLVLSQLGLFTDVYPDPEKGLHFELTLGLGVLSADNSAPDENPLGFSVSIGAGHEWWVGEQWSVGALVRVFYATLFYDSGLDERHHILAPGLLATFTYH